MGVCLRGIGWCMKKHEELGWEYKSCRYSSKLISAIEYLNMNAEKTVHISAVNKAIYFAKRYHSMQMRQSGLPYYSHPLEVAYMSLKYVFEEGVIIASILHDTIEDTEATLEIIENEFGFRIAEMVEMLTRDKSDGRKLSIEQIFDDIFKRDDKEVMLIKILDRLHNLETIHVKSSEKQLHTTQETLKNFLILAEIIERPDLSELLYHRCSDINKELSSESEFYSLGEGFRLPVPFSQRILH